MAVSTSSGGSASTFLAVLRRCKRRGGASSAAAGRRHCARVNAAAQRCRLRTMVGSRGPIGSSLCGFRALWVSSCSGVWWLRALLVAQALNAASGAYWQLNEPYYCLYYRFCGACCAFSRPLCQVKCRPKSPAPRSSERRESCAEPSPHGLPEPRRTEKAEKKDPRAAASGQTTQPSAVAWKEPPPSPLIESKRGRRPGRARHAPAREETR